MNLFTLIWLVFTAAVPLVLLVLCSYRGGMSWLDPLQMQRSTAQRDQAQAPRAILPVLAILSALTLLAVGLWMW